MEAMAASTAATVSSGRGGGRGCGGWKWAACGDRGRGGRLGALLEFGLGCEGVECAASASVGSMRLGLGSAAEEEEEDAALVDGCVVVADGGSGGGLGMAAAFMAEDFFWLGYRPGLD